MYKGRSFIGVIPARGGSKGLPGKNIRKLCGKPLIVWSIESGLESKYLDEVMLTTDCREIADVAKGAGASVPFLRPDELAQDNTGTVEVVEHALAYYQDQLNREYDYVVLLEPTSPLRESSDIDCMIEKIVELEGKFDSIVSVGEVHEHPSIMKQMCGDILKAYCDNLPQTIRRQDNFPAYFPYGVAYIVRTSVLISERSFYPERTTWYKIKRYQNYEIDDIYDFLAVENILKYEKGLA